MLKQTLVTLASDMSNKANFVNSLFDPDVRDPSDNGLPAAISAGNLFFPYADTASRGLILNAWLAAWAQAVGAAYDADAAARCPTQDRELLSLLATYLKTNELFLSTPSLSFDHLDPTSNLAVYRNGGYDRVPFVANGTWNLGTFDTEGNMTSDPTTSAVARFLTLLFYGAHVVVVSSSKDRNGGNTVADLQSTLEAELPKRSDPYNSHYGGAALDSGIYYLPQGAPDPSFSHLDVETLATSHPPGLEPLIFAQLVGVTASTYENDFLQLEGWPAQDAADPPGGSRHNADYQANEATLWNFSTFGCCAFSEKRSTPIFLANDDFDLTIQPDTHMPHYWGANAGNVGASWMHPDLVVIGSSS